MVMTIQFGPDIVDRAWNTFNGDTLRRWERSYERESRRGSQAQRFEDWLWAHGGKIVQKNKVRYLVFGVESKASFFLMKLK